MSLHVIGGDETYINGSSVSERCSQIFSSVSTTSDKSSTSRTMFSRNFFIFSAVLLLVALVSVSAQSDETDFESSLDIAERSKIGKKVEQILKKFFKNVTDVCLKQAVDKCKKHWYNPAKVIQCAKDFFSIENIGCLVGA